MLFKTHLMVVVDDIMNFKYFVNTVTNSVHIQSMVLAANRAARVQNNAVMLLQAVNLQRQVLN